MSKYILIFSLLIIISLNSSAQLSNLNDSIRKSETTIKTMMKDYVKQSEFYDENGKILCFSYSSYVIFFEIGKYGCSKVDIYSTNEKISIDDAMYKWLYEKGYESAGHQRQLWGKMIQFKAANGDIGSYPVSVIRIDNASWRVFDMLLQAK